MSKGKRDTYASDFKLKAAIEATSSDKTLTPLASEYHVHPSQIMKWEERLKDNASTIFGAPSKRQKKKTVTDAVIMEKVDRLNIGNDWLKSTKLLKPVIAAKLKEPIDAFKSNPAFGDISKV